jgi:hypothetical protein
MYLLILASVIPITIFTLQHKGYAAAFGLAFLFVMTFTGCLVARRSIACKNDLRAYRNYMLKGLASLLTAFGAFLLFLSIQGWFFFILIFCLHRDYIGGQYVAPHHRAGCQTELVSRSAPQRCCFTFCCDTCILFKVWPNEINSCNTG